MSTLYSINRDIERVIETGFSWDDETGEVTFDSSDLEALGDALREKLVACGCWLKGRRALAKAIRAEERALRERRERIERQVERLEGYVTESLEKVGGSVESPEVSMRVHRSVRTVVDDEAALPPEFVREVTTVRVDRQGLRDALKAGEVPGAHLEGHDNLRLR